MKSLRENGGDTGDTKHKGDNHRRTKNQISLKKTVLFVEYIFIFIGMKDGKFPSRSRFVAVTLRAG